MNALDALPVFSNKIYNTSASVFTNQLKSETDSQRDKTFHDAQQEYRDTKISAVNQYIDNSSSLMTATLGRNSFGSILGLDALSQKNMMEFKVLNQERKVEAAYATTEYSNHF